MTVKDSRAPLVLHVIYRLDHGGLENGLVNLVNRMPTDRFRHGIVCLAGFTDFRHRIQRDDVHVYSLDKRPGTDLGAYWRFWRLLRRLRPDIVHTRNLGTIDLQWLAWLAGIKGRVHGEHGWGIADTHGLGRRGLIIRRACRRVIQRYVAVSRDIATLALPVCRRRADSRHTDLQWRGHRSIHGRGGATRGRSMAERTPA